MVGREFRLHNGEKGAALTVKVNKNSKADKILKILKDGTVLVSIKNDSTDLNIALVNFLSRQLDIPKMKFDIIAGDEGGDKILSILDIEPKKLQNLIISKIP